MAVSTITVLPDTDNDGVADVDDIDDDNDGILDIDEQTVTFVSLSDTATYSYAQNVSGGLATHYGEEGTGTGNDPDLLFDGDINTEQRMHQDDIIEYDLGQLVPAGTSITLSEGSGGEDTAIAVYVSFGTTDPDGDTAAASGNGVGYQNAVTNGQSVLVYSGLSDSTITFTVPIDATHIQFVGLDSHGGWAEINFTTSTQVVTNLDSDGDGRPDHLDIDKDNDGITDNVEAQTTAGYIAPSGQGLAMIDVNSDGLDDNYAGGLTEVDSDGDGTVDTLDLDSDDDGILDVAERGDAGPTATPTAPYNDADNDGLLDEFEAGTTTDGYDVNDANINGDDGGVDGNYTNFTLADSDLDTNANEAVPGRTSNDAVVEITDLDFRDSDPDTDLDGIQDSVDIDDDNDGILDTVEQTVTYTSLATSATVTANQKFDGSGGGSKDLDFLVDGDTGTEPEIAKDTIVEYDMGQTVLAGTQITFTEGSSSHDGNVEIYISDGTQAPNVYANAVTGGGSVLVYSGPATGDITITASIDFTHMQIVSVNDKAGWVEMEFASLNQVIATRDSDGDGRPDHLDIDKDNDGITDNVEAQTTAGYIAPSGQGTAMIDFNSDGLDDNYAGGLTEVDSDGDGTADTLDLDSDDDGILDVAERGGPGPTATPTAPYNDADNDGLLDEFEAGTTSDGYDVNDENLDTTDTNFLLADSDNDTAADGSDAVPLIKDLDYREDHSLDTDNDGVADVDDIDDDNDGILDIDEQTVTFVSLSDTATYSYAQNVSGGLATHYGEEGTGTGNDPDLLFDGDINTEQRMHQDDIIEYDLGQLVPAGTSITLSEGSGGEDTAIAVYVSFGTTDPDGDTAAASGNGVGYQNAVTNGQSVLVYSGLSDSTITFTVPIDATHIQFVGLDSHGGWAEINFTTSTQVVTNLDSDGDGRPDHLDIDKDNDGITDNVEAQTTAGYIAPSGQGLAMIDVNSDGLDDNYAGGLTEVDSDGDGTVDTLDLDSDDDGILDVAERGDAGPTATPTAPYNDADNDGLLDEFEAGTTTDGYDVNDANINGDDGGVDGNYTNFTLADSDLDTNANEAVPGRTSNDAVVEITDLDFRDSRIDFIDIDEILTTPEDGGNLIGSVLTGTSSIYGTVTVTGFSVVGTNYAPGSTVSLAVGDLTLNTNGDFTFSPTADYTGIVPLVTYTMTDGVTTDTSMLSITVTPVNDAPTSVALANQSNDDSETVLLDVSGSFSDVDAGDSLTFSATGLPPGLSIDASGNITGTIDSSASTGGPYSVTVTATDTGGLTTSQTFTWAVANPAPVANDDAYTTDEDTALTVPATGVLGNDIDADGDALTAAVATGPANGSVTVNGDGSFTYTPDVDFNGTDTFTYTVTDADGATDTATVTINVTPVNDAPVDGDETANVTEDTTLTVDATSGLLANATDTEGDSLSITDYAIAGISGTQTVGSVVTIPGVGGIQINADGSYSFAPVNNYTGAVPVVTYTVSDGNGGTDTSTLTLTMVPVNDAPDAVDNSYTTAEDTALTIAAPGVLGNDTDVDGDTLTVTTNTAPANGAVLVNADGSLTYTPDVDFNGTDTFTYTISDGNGGSDTATVTITVDAVNDAPTSVALANQSNDDSETVLLDVSGSFSDVDAGDSLTFSATGLPPGLSIDASGNITGTIDSSASTGGPYSVTVTATDTGGLTTSQTFTWAVANPAPVANDDAYTTDEDTALTVPATGVLGNDIDADGDALTAAVATGPANGSVTVNGDGSFTYTPDVDFNGTDTFTYTVTDADGATDTATVTINVTPVNDAPVDGDETANVTEDTTLTVDATSGLLANATDTEGDSLSITDYAIAGISGTQTVGSVVTIPGVGGIQINADGSYSFAPVNNYTGAVPVVTYTVSDGNGGTDTSTLTLTMVPVNDAPVAIDDIYKTDEDVPVSGNAITQDTGSGVDIDVDGDTLTLEPGTVGTFATTQGGSITLTADGIFTYTPDVDFNGLDRFDYTVRDGNGGTDIATLFFQMRPINDAPIDADDIDTVTEDVTLTVDAVNGSPERCN